MKTLHIVMGIVAEGGTDVVVLEEYLSTWLAKRSIVLDVRPVQPAIDATSGRLGDGGWTWVKTWCEENSASSRADLFLPLFDGEQPLDILVVQLDGDRIEDYTRSHSDITVPVPANAHARGAIVKEVLERWLWGSAQARSTDPNRERHCLVATVRALETWLVAGLDSSLSDPEEIQDPEQELMKLRPDLNIKVVGGVTRLKKDVLSWQNMARQTVGALPHICSTCDHCRAFLADVDALIQQRQ